MPPSRLQVGTKTTEGHNQAGNTLHPYEVQRLRQVMRNNARLQQLGIPGLCDTLPKAYSFHHNKNKPNFTNNEDSESDYNPSSNDTGEEDLLDDDNVQGSKDYNMRTTNMSNGVIKLRTKRLLAEKESIRITRSKKLLPSLMVLKCLTTTMAIPKLQFKLVTLLYLTSTPTWLMEVIPLLDLMGTT